MEKKKFKQRVDEFYGVTKHGSSFKVETIAGIATFLAMAYILVVNPSQILSDSDPRWASMFIATAFGAIVGTLLMSFYAKMPLAQASGMGLNSTVGTIIGAGIGGIIYSLSNALVLVFFSGVVFLVVSIVPIFRDKTTGQLVTIREKIYDGMPKSLIKAISVGIGFFIAFIGMQNAKIVSADQWTLVKLVDFTKMFTEGLYYTPEAFVNADGVLVQPGPAINDFAFALVGLISFFSIAILSRFKVKGAVIFGILVATIVAIPLHVANIDTLLGKDPGVSWKFWENLGAYFSKDGVFLTMFKDGFNMPEGSLMTSIMLVITFSMMDMFDTMGTVVGCTTNAGLVDENGKPLNYNKIMLSDSVATVTGSLLGTSTVTTFVESGTGVAAGGKTGFTALITSLLFLLSVFLLPLFAFIPKAAAAGALIYVGVLMVQNVVNLELTSVRSTCASFMTIIMMILTYSITNGIGMGVITYVVITFFSNILSAIKYAVSKNKNEEDKPKWDISPVLWVIFVLFLIYFLVPTSF